MSDPIIATWHVSLLTECPACKKRVDLLDYCDFWDAHSRLEIPEHHTERTTGMEVVCPDCSREFCVDLEY